MSTTLQSNKIAPSPAQPKFLPAGDIAVVAQVQVAAAPGVGDVWQLAQVPAGASITALALACGLDTNATPTMKLSVGDSTSATQLVSGAVQPAGGGVIYANNPASMGYQPAATDTVQVTVNAAAATFTSGTVTAVIKYSMDA